MKKSGVVTALSRKRNFILIRPEGEERRVFCHRSEIVADEDIEQGSRVVFDMGRGRRHEARKVELVG